MDCYKQFDRSIRVGGGIIEETIQKEDTRVFSKEIL